MLFCLRYLGKQLLTLSYTPCLKKTVPTYFLLFLCQIWTDFNKNWKNCSRRNPSQNSLECPLHLKFVLALPWEIRSVRLSRQRSNSVCIWMINRIATNMTDGYCLSNVVRVTSHNLYFSVCSKYLPPARTQARRRWRHSLTALSITVWLWAAHSLMMFRFSLSTSEILVRQTHSWSALHTV